MVLWNVVPTQSESLDMILNCEYSGESNGTVLQWSVVLHKVVQAFDSAMAKIIKRVAIQMKFAKQDFSVLR